MARLSLSYLKERFLDVETRLSNPNGELFKESNLKMLRPGLRQNTMLPKPQDSRLRTKSYGSFYSETRFIREHLLGTRLDAFCAPSA